MEVEFEDGCGTSTLSEYWAMEKHARHCRVVAGVMPSHMASYALVILNLIAVIFSFRLRQTYRCTNARQFQSSH